MTMIAAGPHLDVYQSEHRPQMRVVGTGNCQNRVSAVFDAAHGDGADGEKGQIPEALN